MEFNATQVSILHPIIERILIIPQDKLQKSFARAFKDSISLTAKEIPCVAHIYRDHGINIETQVEYGIALTKKSAKKFLYEYGKNIKGNDLNKKYLNDKKYLSTFNRASTRLGNKSLVFTIAEVQKLVDYGQEFDIPQEILAIISK